MKNDTDKVAPWKPSEEEDRFLRQLPFMGVFLVVGLALAVVVGVYTHGKEPVASSVAATAELGRPSPRWEINVRMSGSDWYRNPHELTIVMSNANCPIDGDWRCCNTDVTLDGARDAETAHGLCNELEANAIHQAMPDEPSMTRYLLDEFAWSLFHRNFRWRSFERGLTSHDVHVTYVDDP